MTSEKLKVRYLRTPIDCQPQDCLRQTFLGMKANIKFVDFNEETHEATARCASAEDAQKIVQVLSELPADVSHPVFGSTNPSARVLEGEEESAQWDKALADMEAAVAERQSGKRKGQGRGGGGKRARRGRGGSARSRDD